MKKLNKMEAKCLGIFLICFMLVSCIGCQYNKTANRQSDPTAFYTCSNGEAVWLENSKKLAIPNGLTIQLVNLDNTKEREIILDVAGIDKRYQDMLRIYPSEFGIIAAIEHFDSDTGQLYKGSLCLSEQGWEAVNLFIFDWEGNLLKTFDQAYEVGGATGSSYAYTEKDQTIKVMQQAVPVWRSADKILFNTGIALFEYDLESQQLVLLDDRTQYIPQGIGRESVFWQIRTDQCQIERETFYYSASADATDSTNMRLYKVNDFGKEELFSDIPFQIYTLSNDAIILGNIENMPNDIWYGYVTDGQLNKIQISADIKIPIRMEGQQAYWCQKTKQGVWQICCLDIGKEQLSCKDLFAGEQVNYVELWGIENGSIYMAVDFQTEDQLSYLKYDSESEKIQQLQQLDEGRRNFRNLQGPYYLEWNEEHSAVRIQSFAEVN